MKMMRNLARGLDGWKGCGWGGGEGGMKEVGSKFVEYLKRGRHFRVHFV